MVRESLGYILGDTLSKGFTIVLVPMPELKKVNVEVNKGNKMLSVLCDLDRFEGAIGMLIKGLRVAIGTDTNSDDVV